MTYYHFLDEAGDPGLIESEGSSPYFALAMVRLPNRVNRLPQLIKLRQQLHLQADFEFKYRKANDHQKIAFFEAIHDMEMRIRAVFIYKTTAKKLYPSVDGEAFKFKFIADFILRASSSGVSKDILIIDGVPDFWITELRKNITTLKRKHKLTRRWVQPFKKYPPKVKSRNEDGLQLADMIVGAIRDYMMGKTKKYYAMFADKVVDLWEVK